MRIAGAIAASFALAVLQTGTPRDPAATTVAEVAGIGFVSDPLLNLHHVLYGAAWARRPDRARSLSDDLPGPLTASMSEADERTWSAALDYYDQHLITHDLLRDGRMVALQAALVARDPGSSAVPPGLSDVLASALPVYQRYFWSAHDAANRAWIAETAPRVQEIAALVIPRLESLYDAKWFASPIRVDVVWVANREGAYTTLLDPPHVTIEPAEKGWTAVEIVFHECSHVLAASLLERLSQALGDKRRSNGALPHAVLFYVTGAVVQDALKSRGIAYTPASAAMFSRVWPQYRSVVEGNWEPYVHGRRSLEQAIAATAGALH
jgi:hypothetical protein